MAKSQDEAWENPLVPHALMRRMYEAMLELRAIERGRRGEEGCRASSLLSLGAGDLVSDVAGSLAGTKGRSGSRGSVLERTAPGTHVLRTEADAFARLMLAVGAASALRVQGAGRLVLAYVEGDALPPARWKQVLGAAGRLEVPMVFVLLPTESVKRQGAISDRAQGWGVPGMPVDAADAIALYRVMQESVLRARSGDGPALVECVTWRVAGSETPTSDGVKALRTVLERKGLLATKRGTGARGSSGTQRG